MLLLIAETLRKPKVRRVRTIGGLLFLIVFFFMLAPHLAEIRLKSLLASTGFSDASIGKVSFTPGSLLATPVNLDSDEFSTIGRLRGEGGLIGLVTGKPARLVIEDLSLTGEWMAGTGLTIAGWHVPVGLRPLPLLDLGHIILESGHIDLDTPAGALRLGGKGEISPDPDTPGVRRFEASFGGAQHQLTMDTHWKGVIKTNGLFQVETEIREAKFNLDKVSGARITGWLNMALEQAGKTPTLGGQFQIGYIDFGGTGLNNITLTIDGPWKTPRMIAMGTVGAYEGMKFLSETQNGSKGLSVKIVVESPHFSDLRKFLAGLRSSPEAELLLKDALLPLLITDGNLERIGHLLEKEKPQSVALEVEGYAQDLSGKIIARKIRNGALQSEVISLNPATSAGP